MPLIFEVTFGESGWEYTMDLLKGRLNELVPIYQEQGIISDDYKKVHSICMNMLYGRYWSYELKDQEEHIQEFLEAYPRYWHFDEG